MTATEELRRLLDERGVEWWEESGVKISWFGLGWAYAEPYKDGLLNVTAAMTPAEAIEATLGRGECSVAAFGTCSKCGAHLDGIYQRYCPNCGRNVVEE